MKVLFITRSTLYKGFGGDSVQLLSTARHLRNLGVDVDIRLCNEEIDYRPYDLVHFFNAIRPADLLRHARLCNKPYVVSPIFVDYTAFEKSARKGLKGVLAKILPAASIEYFKTISRWLLNGEKIQSLQYLYLGHKRSIQKLIRNAKLLLPNSYSEYLRLERYTGISKPYEVVYNGIEVLDDYGAGEIGKENDLVICVARIDGNKNQLNLIRALNNTRFRLLIIGKPAPNHRKYYEQCCAEAAENVKMMGFLEGEKLRRYYHLAKVHVLPSFNETCGLSTLEAAYYRCSLVITEGGDTREYFGDEAFYCDPSNVSSILQAVELASAAPYSKFLRQRTLDEFTWAEAARSTKAAYTRALQF